MIYGVGYNTRHTYSTCIEGTSKHNKCYSVWISMLGRCYSEVIKSKQPCYAEVYCCEEWKDYQNFAHFWHTCPYRQDGWALEKDYLVKGNKVYSPQTCCFVPQEINNLFCGGRYRLTDTDLTKGVSKSANGKKYLAAMKRLGKTVRLGTFATKEEAERAYKAERKKYIDEQLEKYSDIVDPKLMQNIIKLTGEI